ncbi:MAG TPA: glycosyltransferase family 4 protein [Chloroflexota bacterium]|nr:glycosyltransferase family 4 protein [Chloroflexota bacterium]
MITTTRADSPLRIAHITATFPPYRGGTGNVAWHNAHQLARLGHEPHVFTADHGAAGGETVAPSGVKVHRLRPLMRLGNAPLLAGLLPALRRFDLLHLHYPFYFGAEMVLAASRLFRIPYVITYHNDVEFQGSLAFLPRVHHRLIGWHILARAHRLLFTTRDYGRTSYAAPLADRPTAGELPNGVDVERFTPALDGQAVRLAHGVGQVRPVLLFVAALDRPHYFKGLPVLFEAMRLLGEAAPDLIVVGDGDLRPTYERQAAAMQLHGRVRFAGRVSDDDLPHHYAAADLVVLPSVTRGEAFGVVLLEALACAKPVIATDLPGVRAVVRSTGGGRLVPPGDAPALAQAVACLASNPALRAALGQAGRRAVEARYAWPTIGRQLEGTYHAVLGRTAPRNGSLSP